MCILSLWRLIRRTVSCRTEHLGCWGAGEAIRPLHVPAQDRDRLVTVHGLDRLPGGAFDIRDDAPILLAVGPGLFALP